MKTSSGDLFHTEWVVVVYLFWGIDLFHLSCQIYVCRVFCSILYFYLISAVLVIISPISFSFDNFCLFSLCPLSVFLEACHFLYWSFQRTRSLLIDFFYAIFCFQFHLFLLLFLFFPFLLIFGSLFCSSFLWPSDEA